MKRIKRNNRGFTMAELLIVVAIIAVLSGVGFIAVQNYSRGMAQLERDSIAKEIFVAAQNHLTQANSQGYPGVTAFGETEDPDNNIFYYAVNDTEQSFTVDGTSAIDQMLPFGSIDEAVRAGGTYIIRYQPNPATVLDVFYCPPTGQYPRKLKADDYNTLMETCKGDEKRNDRRDYHGAVIGWYGGAESLEIGAEINAPDIRVENGDRLTVKVYNTNQATMGPPEAGNEEVSLKLIIKGVDSGAMMAIPMFYVSDIKRYSTPTQRYALNGEYLDAAQEGSNPVLEYTVVLDDIATLEANAEDIEDMRFAALNDLSQYMNSVRFIPGEDIVVSAVAYSNKKLTNIAYSREYTTNSLFADKVPVEGSTESTDPNVGTPSVATVASIRHLENLDTAVSQFAKDAAAQNKLNIQKVEQTQDLDWSAFKTAIAPNPEDAESVRILYNDGGMTEAGCYKPVDIGYALTYDGMTTLTEAPAEGNSEEEDPPEPVTTQVIHEIKNIRVNTDADAGVFGRVSEIGTIKNLKIVDCDIASTGVGSSAGALAGELNGVDVLNVTAYGKSTFKNAEGKDVTRNVVAMGNAGGLVGKLTAKEVGDGGKAMTYGSVVNCAAALYVNGGKDAGGLVGAISGTGAQVKASYSGGHTDHGCYYVVEEKGGAVSLKLEDGKPVPIVNVTGADNVGGLIGSAGDATVEKCYSTCSVKGQTAGGLAGTAGGEIRNCYCTGLVVGATAPAGDGDEGGDGEGGDGADDDVGKGTCGAFAGKLNSATVTNCLYYGIINDGLPALGEGTAAGISELDADAASYNAFVGAPNAWNAAQPYDATLETYYKDATAEPTSRFNLRTVDQLDPTMTNKAKSNAVHYGDWPAPETFVANTKAA